MILHGHCDSHGVIYKNVAPIIKYVSNDKLDKYISYRLLQCYLIGLTKQITVLFALQDGQCCDMQDQKQDTIGTEDAAHTR